MKHPYEEWWDAFLNPILYLEKPRNWAVKMIYQDQRGGGKQSQDIWHVVCKDVTESVGGDEEGWEWGEFAIPNRMFRGEGEKRQNIWKKQRKGKKLSFSRRVSALSRIWYCVCRLNMDHGIFHYIFMSWWGTSLSYWILKARSSHDWKLSYELFHIIPDGVL